MSVTIALWALRFPLHLDRCLRVLYVCISPVKRNWKERQRWLSRHDKRRYRNFALVFYEKNSPRAQARVFYYLVHDHVFINAGIIIYFYVKKKKDRDD